MWHFDDVMPNSSMVLHMRSFHLLTQPNSIRYYPANAAPHFSKRIIYLGEPVPASPFAIGYLLQHTCTHQSNLTPHAEQHTYPAAKRFASALTSWNVPKVKTVSLPTFLPSWNGTAAFLEPGTTWCPWFWALYWRIRFPRMWGVLSRFLVLPFLATTSETIYYSLHSMAGALCCSSCPHGGHKI